MNRIESRPIFSIVIIVFLGVALLWVGGCSTAPKQKNQQAFINDADAAMDWFSSNVHGLDEQIAESAGYIIFPSVGQWGIIFTGGQYGRGMLDRPDGSQIGWAAINTGSIGLQAGVQGFKMLVVIENESTMAKFMENQLQGSAGGVVIVGETGGSSRAHFDNGLAVYQGANTGLMAGVNVGLDYIRYKPLD